MAGEEHDLLGEFGEKRSAEETRGDGVHAHLHRQWGVRGGWRRGQKGDSPRWKRGRARWAESCPQ